MVLSVLPSPRGLIITLHRSCITQLYVRALTTRLQRRRARSASRLASFFCGVMCPALELPSEWFEQFTFDERGSSGSRPRPCRRDRIAPRGTYRADRVHTAARSAVVCFAGRHGVRSTARESTKQRGEYRWQRVQNIRVPADSKPDGRGYGFGSIPAGAGTILNPADIYKRV